MSSKEWLAKLEHRNRASYNHYNIPKKFRNTKQAIKDIKRQEGKKQNDEIKQQEEIKQQVQEKEPIMQAQVCAPVKEDIQEEIIRQPPQNPKTP